jgi:hypothetical protein
MTEVIEHQATPLGAGSDPAWDQLQTLLIPGEVVMAYGLEHRLYALSHRRHVAAATTGRFIFLRRPLLGGYVPFDVRWQDLKDARLAVGMFSATLTLSYAANLSDTSGGEGELRVLQVPGLCREAAQALYRQCQAEGQAWREKRRVRSIEEMRAQSGGVQIATGVYPQSGAERSIEQQAGEDPAERLGRAKRMLSQGLITDSEYEAIKAKIVGAL